MAGFILLAVSRCLVCIAKSFLIFWFLRPYWNSISDIPYLGTFLLTIPLSFAFVQIWNGTTNAQDIREREVEAHGDMLMEGQAENAREHQAGATLIRERHASLSASHESESVTPDRNRQEGGANPDRQRSPVFRGNPQSPK